jgi:membrane protein
MHAQLKRIRALLFDTDLLSLRGRIALWPVYLARLIVHVGRQWMRDRCPSLASALAFETALCLVPGSAVAFALLKATGALEARSALVEFLSNSMFPVYGERITSTLLQFADNINAGVLGAAGSGTAIVIAFFMFMELERIFNDVWRVTQRRGVLSQFVIFYTLITLVPLLVGLSLVHSAHFWRASKGVLGFVAPMLSVWVALVLANRLLPRARVQWRSAMIGALVSAVLFELAKRAFTLYLSDLIFRRYTGIYGALALLPLLLMWIYFTWLVVLLGTEVAFAVQNLHSLEAVERRSRATSPEDHANGVVASRLLYSIADAFHRGRKAVTRAELAEHYQLPVEVVVRIIERLKAVDLVVEVEGDVSGYMLARSPSEITVEAALSSFRAVDVRTGSEHAEKLNRVLRELESLRRGSSDRVTYADLLAANGGGPTADAP